MLVADESYDYFCVEFLPFGLSYADTWPEFMLKRSSVSPCLKSCYLKHGTRKRVWVLSKAHRVFTLDLIDPFRHNPKFAWLKVSALLSRKIYKLLSSMNSDVRNRCDSRGRGTQEVIRQNLSKDPLFFFQSAQRQENSFFSLVRLNFSFLLPFSL